MVRPGSERHRHHCTAPVSFHPNFTSATVERFGGVNIAGKQRMHEPADRKVGPDGKSRGGFINATACLRNSGIPPISGCNRNTTSNMATTACRCPGATAKRSGACSKTSILHLFLFSNHTNELIGSLKADQRDTIHTERHSPPGARLSCRYGQHCGAIRRKRHMRK